MGAGQKAVKWLMLIFNLIFWISGIGLIIAGAVAQTVYKPYIGFLDGSYVSAPVLLIVVGAIITIIAFFGCCGSAKENYCMLVTFAVLLGIIFCVELAGGIAGYVERGRVSEYLQTNMEKSLTKFNATKDWDAMQKELECCGVQHYDDWITKSNKSEVPPSCCKQDIPVDTCNRNATYLTINCVGGGEQSKACPIYTSGCFKLVKAKLENSIGIIGGVGIGVAFIQIIGIAFACFLAQRVRRGYTYA